MLAVASLHKNYPELFGLILRKEAHFEKTADALTAITQRVGSRFHREEYRNEA